MRRKKQPIGKFGLYYTVLFVVLAVVIYSPFWLNGKSFVYAMYGDGHICFNSFVYYGRWLRHIGMTLLNEHRLSIPLWDLSVGYGSDILITFNWMTIGDLLNLLSAFVSADRAEYLYSFLAIFRIYLAGAAFSVYGSYHRHDKAAVMCGSLIYAFCGFALFAGVRDVYFMSPMVYFPILLLGVDKIYRKEKPYVLILTAALAGVTNFYYFFMLSVWVFIYGIYRYFMVFGRQGLRVGKIAGWLIKFIACYCIGIAMAAFMLFPIIGQLLGTERFAHQSYVPILYSFDYYWKLLVRFITSESMEGWTHLGYAPFCLIAVFVLFLKKDRKYLPYKIGFCMCALFLMIPAVGSLMNAGSYAVNRWVWAFSMLVAYIFVVVYPELFRLTAREKARLILLCCGYGLLCLVRTEFRTSQMLVMLVIFLIGLLLLLLGDYITIRPETGKLLVVGSLMAGILANGILRFAGFGSNYASGFVDRGRAWGAIHDDLPSRAIEDMPDASTVRYDSLENLEPMYNTAMNHDLNGTDFYFSLADGNITRYFDELNVNVELEQRYKGVDQRTILERLAGVRYCIAGKSSEDFVPYGYDTVAAASDRYTVYENEAAPGISYTYDSWIPYEEYKELPAVRKQQAMIQCAAVETASLKKAAPVYSERQTDYALNAESGIEVLADRIVVSDVNARLTVTAAASADSELYLAWRGIRYEKGEHTDQEQTRISYIREQSEKTQTLYSAKHPYYHGRDDYMINMGYIDREGPVKVEIQFAQPGTYYYNDLIVYAQPMGEIDAWTDKISEDRLTDILIEDNQISGILDLQEKKLLCIAIPYSKGWSAYVDGVKAQTMKVNDAYLGLEVSGGGRHQIVLRYMTPGLAAGMIVSILGAVALVVIVICSRKKSKNNLP